MILEDGKGVELVDREEEVTLLEEVEEAALLEEEGTGLEEARVLKDEGLEIRVLEDVSLELGDAFVLEVLVDLAEDVEVVDDLTDEDLIELLLRRLEELFLTDERIKCDEIIDDENVRVVADPAWSCVDITCKVSTVVKTLSVWQLTQPTKSAGERLESFIPR